MDAVLGRLGGLDPSITLVSESREPMRNTAELSKLAAKSGYQPAAGPAEPTEPAARAALAEFVRDYEEKWLDQQIPALAGQTPRQAANDPTRRDDLIRLLDSFPSDEGNPGAMSVIRLREAALSLPASAAG